jgi:hypothetical protein
MAKQIFSEIENMKANNVSINDMADILASKFGIDNAREWVSTYALANSLGVKATDF